MDFETAWQAAAVGAAIVASDGTPEPQERDAYPRRWALWRSRNFSGTVVEKEPGVLVVQEPATEQGQPVFSVNSGTPTAYTLPTPDLVAANIIAKAEIENAAETQCRKKMRLARQVLAMHIWGEVQMLKLIPDWATLTAEERARRVPFLAALAQKKGVVITTVATAIENRYWDRLWKMAQNHAELVDGHDAVQSATTPEAKIAAAAAVIWTE